MLHAALVVVPTYASQVCADFPTRLCFAHITSTVLDPNVPSWPLPRIARPHPVNRPPPFSISQPGVPYNQMLAAIIFGLLRTLQWGAYYFLLGDPVHVSPSYYSRVLGYNNLAIALVSDITPYGLIAIIVRLRIHRAD